MLPVSVKNQKPRKKLKKGNTSFRNKNQKPRKKNNKQYQQFLYQKYLSYQMLVQKYKPKKKISGPFHYLPERAKKLRKGPLKNFFAPYTFTPQFRQRIKEQSVADIYFTTPDYVCLKILNLITKKGKKRVAYGIFSKTLLVLKKKNIKFPRQMICRLILSLRPLAGLRKKIVSGVVKKFPAPISLQASISVALHWFIKSVRMRFEKSMVDKLVAECLDLYNKKSCLSKKKQQDFHKQIYQSRYLLRRPFSSFVIPKSFLIPNQPFIPNFYSPRSRTSKLPDGHSPRSRTSKLHAKKKTIVP
jgi:small subunit ribosomal protein S7